MTVQRQYRRKVVSNEKVESVAQEIRSYVEGRRNVAETVEGVANWWLARQRFEDSLEIVRAALEYLVKEGVLKKRVSGKQEIYMKTV